jgi:hypothetical protein
MLTKRMHVAALAVIMLLSYNMSAMQTLASCVRFAANHRKLTVATLVATGSVFYMWKNSVGLFKRSVQQAPKAPVANQKPDDLAASRIADFAHVAPGSLTDSQEAIVKQPLKMQIGNRVEQVVQVAGDAAKTAAPYVRQAAGFVAGQTVKAGDAAVGLVQDHWKGVLGRIIVGSGYGVCACACLGKKAADVARSGWNCLPSWRGSSQAQAGQRDTDNALGNSFIEVPKNEGDDEARVNLQ